LLRLPEWLTLTPALAECRAFPEVTEKLAHHALVAEACASAAEHAVGREAVVYAGAYLEKKLVRVLSPSGAVVDEALKALGALQFHWFGQRPESGFSYVAADLDRPAFRRVLADWLLETLHAWRTVCLRPDRDPLAHRLLGVRLEALLGFATCLAERSADALARLCEPESFLEPLAFVCLWPPGKVGHMAAVTLVARLKRVDLDRSVAAGAGGAQLTVLDALFNGLRGGTEVQQRVITELPRVLRLQGVRVLERLESILMAPDASDAPGPLHAGTEVLAAAELLANLLNRGALADSAVRRRTTGALRMAVVSPAHRRPLYRKVGVGAEGDPVTLVSTGNLQDELRKVMTRW
jgi:hypothetical protein